MRTRNHFNNEVNVDNNVADTNEVEHHFAKYQLSLREDECFCYSSMWVESLSRREAKFGWW